MARTNNLTDFLTDVSSAIKQKTGDNTPIPASEFDSEILSIETGGNYQEKTLSITQNGNYNLLPDTGYDAMSSVGVNVSVPTGTDTSDATAKAEDIRLNKTAYADGSKLTGTAYVAENIYGTLDYQNKQFTVEYIGRGGSRPYPSTYVFGRLTIRYSYNAPMYIYLDGDYIGTYTAKYTDQKYLGVVYYDEEEYVFIVNNTSIYTANYEAISVNIVNKTITDLGQISTLDTTASFRTTGKECQLGTNHYLYRYKKGTNTFKRYSTQLRGTFPYFTGNGFAIWKATSDGYINRFSYNENSDSYSLSYKSINNVDGVNFYGNKIFMQGNVYVLNEDLSVGSLIASNVYTSSTSNGAYFYWLNESYVIWNGYLYMWNDETNTLTKYIPMNYATLTGYITSDNIVTLYTFNPSSEVIGVHVNDYDFYFANQPTNATSTDVLFGKSVYTSGAEKMIGSMPNNGALSYTPSTSQQTIPAGYTSGGTISAVTSAIDSNIQAENIKKDVEILGVTGTLEPDDPEYDTNLALSYQILGIEPYMVEVEKITSQIDDIDYPAGDLGSISLTSMKLEMHPQLNIPVTTEDATDIADLFNNGTSLTIELHNAHGGGSQLLIADGGITFDCGDMAHISYEWKENPWSGTPGQMLATPVWSAEQAWDILDVESKSPLTQEDLDKVITAFNDGWYPINEGYLRLQWSYRSGYTLTSVDKQNINSLLTYLFKYLGITLTDTSLT